MPQKRIHYCSRCLIPSTRPGQKFDTKGVCNACRYFEQRKNIDWDARWEQFKGIMEKHRSKDGSNYDCIIPVSGGKDSHCQVIKMLQLGLRPLCVYAAVDKPSEIGKRNLENMKNLGVDCIEISTNPIIRNKVDKISLMEIGDISWAENVAIFTIPVRIAVQMKIPVLIWGENFQNEFGGPEDAANNTILDKHWLDTFGGLLGFEVDDLVEKWGFNKRDFQQFVYPSDEELRGVGVTGLFLGSYIPWDGYAHALLAQAHGFEMWPVHNEGALNNYEHMDNLHAGIHDYFKYLKLGFSRTTDHASLHIRRGRLSRADGLEAVKKYDGHYPWTYLETTLEEILDDIGMTMDEFNETCDKFTNRDLFKCDSRGNLIRREDGSPEKLNDDNVEDIALTKKDLTTATA
ncbi:N-acetyl sugar amidotransferase [Candidatus Peregrinibacteria bacterium]|nr:N-acetyl sugar amidotransferase [Candidatus Peregrinibacteria bacterium]